MEKKIAKDIDEYISWFPSEVQKLLVIMRETIKKAAPQAEEKISYAMPSFYFKGTLVYFAANKNHIGFYPTGAGIKAFENQLQDYKFSKGAIQFPYSEPLPTELIRKIVLYKVEENNKIKKK